MPVRQWFGIYIGRVSKTRTQDTWVRMQVPQILGTAETNWAAPAGGAIASSGQIVLAMFVGGDINCPVYLTCDQKLR